MDMTRRITRIIPSVKNSLIRKILAFHFNLFSTSTLGQFCFDLFEAGLESDEICYFAGSRNDLDREALKYAIESTLDKYGIKMPLCGDESSLCLLWNYVESFGIDFDKLSFEALKDIAAFVSNHFDEPYEGVAYTLYEIAEDYQISLCHYPHNESVRLLDRYINDLKSLYKLSLSQPYFRQFIN